MSKVKHKNSGFNGVSVDMGDYVTHDIFDSDLTTPTEWQLKETFAEIMREQGITINTDFAFRVSVTWNEAKQ